MNPTEPRKNPYVGRYGIESIETYQYMLFVEAPIDTAAEAVGQVMGVVSWEKDVLEKSLTVSGSAMAVLQLSGHRWTALSPMTLTCGDLLKAAPEVARKTGARTVFVSTSDDPDFVHYALFSENGDTLEEVESGAASYFRERFEDSAPADDEDEALRKKLTKRGGVLARSTLRDVSKLSRRNVEDEDGVNSFLEGLELFVPPIPCGSEMEGNTFDFSLTDVLPEEAVRMDLLSLKPPSQEPSQQIDVNAVMEAFPELSQWIQANIDKDKQK